MTAFADTPVTLDGQTKTVGEWCQERGLNINTVISRRKRGDNWQQALGPSRQGTAMRQRRNAEMAGRNES